MIMHQHVQTSEPMTRDANGYEIPVKLFTSARNQVFVATNGELYLRNGLDLVAIDTDFDQAVAGDKLAYEAAYQQSGLSYVLKWCIWLGYLPELKMTGTYIPTSERDYRGRIRTA